MARAHGQASKKRIPVALSCSECGGRNYRTSRSPATVGQINLKKFCPTCNQHTIHIDSR